MPSMPGGRGTGRQSIYPADDGDGEELKVETAGAGELTRLQEGIYKGSLFVHFQTQNGVVKGGPGQEGDG